MELDYPYVAYTLDTDDGKQWCVEFIDIPGVVGGGKTQDEAVREAFDNLRIHLDFLKEDGYTIPEPSELGDSYSGKFALRISKSMHRRLALLARQEDISINAYLNEAIAEKVSRDECLKCVKSEIQEMMTPMIEQ